LSGRWVEVVLRDEVVDFVEHWTTRSELPATRLLRWLGLARGKYHDWRARRGRGNAHNGAQPRDFWLLAHERDAIIAFAVANPLEGYRRLAYMMLDADVVAVSPSSVYRVLQEAGLLGRGAGTDSRKGQGFVQPSSPHAHWHIDVSYINLAGTFYYLCAVLDGYSRYIVHWEIRERMQEADIEIIVQRARERVGEVHPRIISDNGPQFVAKDFKEYIRLMGMTHVRTSPFYPQSNARSAPSLGGRERAPSCHLRCCPQHSLGLVAILGRSVASHAAHRPEPRAGSRWSARSEERARTNDLDPARGAGRMGGVRSDRPTVGDHPHHGTKRRRLRRDVVLVLLDRRVDKTAPMLRGLPRTIVDPPYFGPGFAGLGLRHGQRRSTTWHHSDSD
jgi:transposase InsO family protein